LDGLEVWQRLQRPCIHRDEAECIDSGNANGKCTFGDCPFLKIDYNWQKFISIEQSPTMDAPPDEPIGKVCKISEGEAQKNLKTVSSLLGVGTEKSKPEGGVVGDSPKGRAKAGALKGSEATA